jgi:N-methylhydantoinase A
MGKIVAVDTGGTFTDIVLFDTSSRKIAIHKISTSTSDPAGNIIGGLGRIGFSVDEIEAIIHATTIATNTLIERNGARTGFISNQGFRDVIFIQRGDQEHSYDLQWIKPKPLVLRRDCWEIGCRMDHEGNVLRGVDPKEVRQAVEYFKDQGIRTIAIALLFSYVDQAHEAQVRDIIAEYYPECLVSLSNEVYPRWREYERFSTTIADAYLKPMFTAYTRSLASILSGRSDRTALRIMKSNGGVADWAEAIQHPVESIMSGPVGGVLAASYFSTLAREDSVISMDVGGTSTDVCLIRKGSYKYTTSFMLEFGIPISVPMVDVKTIGAGGGSIAWIDKGGLLRVGPQSAGARPGPAAYGLGGGAATITDANVVLGRLNPGYFCGGTIPLYPDKAHQAVEALSARLNKTVAEAANDIVAIADGNMANAIRLITVEKGIDPRGYAILGFGGAGGLHAARVAKILGIRKTIIPVHPGVTSAFGLLTADLRVDRLVTFLMRSDLIEEAVFNRYLSKTRAYALAALRREGYSKDCLVLQSLEMRYYGQNYQIEVPIGDKESLSRTEIGELFELFRKEHKSLYGYENPGDVVECVGMVVRAIGKGDPPRIGTIAAGAQPAPKEERQVYFGGRDGFLLCPVYERSSMPAGFTISGPAIVEEAVSTTLLLSSNRMLVDSFGNLVIEDKG